MNFSKIYFTQAPAETHAGTCNFEVARHARQPGRARRVGALPLSGRVATALPYTINQNCRCCAVCRACPAYTDCTIYYISSRTQITPLNLRTLPERVVAAAPGMYGAQDGVLVGAFSCVRFAVCAHVLYILPQLRPESRTCEYICNTVTQFCAEL